LTVYLSTLRYLATYARVNKFSGISRPSWVIGGVEKLASEGRLMSAQSTLTSLGSLIKDERGFYLLLKLPF